MSLLGRLCRSRIRMIGWRGIPGGGHRPVRTFLSEAFQCKQAWRQRLQAPVLNKVKFEEMYRKVEARLDQGATVSALDIDVLINAVQEAKYMDEVEEVVHRVRLSADAASVLESTQHAFVRQWLELGAGDDHLLRILDDRLNYGIFLDDYTGLLLLDKYIVERRFCRAGKVAALYMLQEDFSNPLIAHMSLFACYNYALDPTPWDAEPTEKGDDNNNDDDDEEEEIKIRVKYIRNPYFDDHFDLRQGADLVGKTLMSAGETVRGELGDSFYIVGSALYDKWESALAKLRSGGKFYRESLEFVGNLIEKQGQRKATRDEATWAKLKTELESSLSEQLGRALDAPTMLDLTEQKIKSLVEKMESEIVAKQKQMYELWNDNRDNMLAKFIEEARREERMENVKKTKEELLRRERELFFFENEDELDLKIENKKVRYPRKWTGPKKKKRSETVEYIPPEVNKPLMS